MSGPWRACVLALGLCGAVLFAGCSGSALSEARPLGASPDPERAPALFDTPTDVAIAGGGVWLASIASAPTPDGGGVRPVHRLERFDPVTLERTGGPIPVPAAWTLAAGPRRLWAAGRGRLDVIDPDAARRIGHVAGLDWAVGDLALGDRGGWVIESRLNRLRRVDTARGRVARDWRRVSRHAMLALALDERWLWVTSFGQRLPRPGVSPTPRGRGTLARLSARTGAVEGILTVGRGPGAVAVGFGSVWVMNGPDGTLSRVDPSRLRATATIRLAEPGGPGAPAVDLAIGTDHVWIADPARGPRSSLRAVDPATNRVSIDGSPPPGGGVAVAVASGPEGVFAAFSSRDGGRLCRVEPANRRLGPCAR